MVALGAALVQAHLALSSWWCHSQDGIIAVVVCNDCVGTRMETYAGSHLSAQYAHTEEYLSTSEKRLAASKLPFGEAVVCAEAVDCVDLTNQDQGEPLR